MSVSTRFVIGVLPECVHLFCVSPLINLSCHGTIASLLVHLLCQVQALLSSPTCRISWFSTHTCSPCFMIMDHPGLLLSACVYPHNRLSLILGFTQIKQMQLLHSAFTNQTFNTSTGFLYECLPHDILRNDVYLGCSLRYSFTSSSSPLSFKKCHSRKHHLLNRR